MRYSSRKRTARPFRLSRSLVLLLAAIIAVAALAGAIPYWMDNGDDGSAIESTQ
ncbi:MAG: hypothetical protein J0I16_22555 [Rhizobiales bacterium]|nr:hypothetical protein [Hyphomicrobiales bacterium]